MYWKKAIDNLPADNQEVLIRSSTIINLAVFNKSMDRFVLKNGEALDPKKTGLLWTNLAGSELQKTY